MRNFWIYTFARLGIIVAVGLILQPFLGFNLVMAMAAIIVGAILSFAVRDSWDVMDLTMVGYICMGVGVLALILAFVTLATRRRRVPPEV